MYEQNDKQTLFGISDDVVFAVPRARERRQQPTANSLNSH
jgi:hypothetical protein